MSWNSCHMSDTWSQVLPAVTALAGVALTFGGTALLEQQKWRRSRRVDLAIRALEPFTDLLRALTEISVTLLQAAEQIQAGALAEVQTLTATINERLGAAQQLLIITRLIGPTSTLPHVNELERNLTALRSLLADVGQTLASQNNAATACSHQLTDAAHTLTQLRDSTVSYLRGPEALRIDRKTPRPKP